MTTERPAFSHQRGRHGLVGPFSGRQLLAGALAVLLVAILGVVVTTPLGNTATDPDLVNPVAAPFIIGEAPPEALRVGATAPELTIDLGDGSTYQLRDLDGRPITLAALRGKVVWLNFFASWCPPCQQETPVLRSLSDKYGDRGLALVGISVQETTPADVRAYADRYQLGYTIGFDGSGEVLREYKVFALPTQFFIDVNGVIRQIVSGPVDERGATALIESMLTEVASP
ncbi:MAG TPA: TlpA disulfide reductase family protein [Candidatus Limnocylindrales bacterium]|nr:TlpA disulfide reductase family protein [Candidatus Limnocylindrales bacterium]